MATPPTIEELQSANITAVTLAIQSLLSYSGSNFNEDCLFMNIWTKPQVGEKKKAVLVWIYGGGFSSGTSSVPGYNGANIVEDEDVIVVSFNYRLSILGFPGNPSAPNNLALLDQRLAVEWVRDNIEKFGGDASRITLFGQSAGGASIDLYSYAWANDTIAHGFIPESGNSFGWGLPNSKDFAANGWFNVTSNLGCGNASSDAEEVLTCMRKQNSTAILNAIPSASGVSGILGFFGPTVDDTVVFSNYTTATPAKVPVLIGNTNYEAGYFRTTFALSGITLPDSFWDAFNLQEFTCPTGIRANVSWAADIPIWRYRYFGVFPNLALSSEAGTWHAAEVPMLFNFIPKTPASTPEQTEIASYMRGAWATFAKDPQKGLLTYEDGWPMYDPTKDTLIRLAFENKTGTNVASPYMYDGYCPFVDVHSTNASAYLDAPSFNPSIPPTPAATGNVSSTGGGASPTGSGSATTTTAAPGLGNRLEISIWIVLAAGFAACM